MNRLKRDGLILAAAVAALTTASSVATQHVARLLGHHPMLGQPVAAGLYQPFAWLAWESQPWAGNVRPAFWWPNMTTAGLFALGTLVFLVVVFNSNGKHKPKPFPDVHGDGRFAARDEI